jgi:hypothetical protein
MSSVSSSDSEEDMSCAQNSFEVGGGSIGGDGSSVGASALTPSKRSLSELKPSSPSTGLGVENIGIFSPGPALTDQRETALLTDQGGLAQQCSAKRLVLGDDTFAADIHCESLQEMNPKSARSE